MSERGPSGPAGSPYRRDGRPFRLRAVLFDFDGTLTAPGEIDFTGIRRAVGCPREIGLLEFFEGIEDPETVAPYILYVVQPADEEALSELAEFDDQEWEEEE